MLICMAKSLNKVQLIGNLGKDPEVKTFEDGGKIANFSLATNDGYKNPTTGEFVERTEWHNIVMRRGLADIAEKYLKKGNTIYVEGKLTTRSWEVPDGKKNYRTEIIVENMLMLGGPGGEGRTSQTGHAPYVEKSRSADIPYSSGDMAGEDDLPF